MGPVVTIHVVRSGALRSLLWLAMGRLWLRRRSGLRFVRVCGTGRGASVQPGFDPGRTVTVAVWNDDAAAREGSAVISGRHGAAAEIWSCRARPLRWRGQWSGFSLDTGDDADDPRAGLEGPVVVLTRATIRWRRLRSFRAMSRTVRAEHVGPPWRAMLGLGDVPLFRLGTLSVWSDADTAVSYARHEPGHVRAVSAARDEGWFGEELFAWFEPHSSSGTWSGRNPLDEATG